MIYTARIEEAIRFASKMHNGQQRIDTETLPYVSHVFAVAVITSNYTSDENTVIAAMLHDVLEDTEATEEEVSTRFGHTVLSYVKAVSEHKTSDWTESKKAYLAQLRAAPTEAMLISVADKMHNISSRLHLMKQVGRKIFLQWSHTPEEYHWYHAAVCELAKEQLQGEIVEDFAELIEQERIAFERR